MSHRSIVIIGNGVTGITAARHVRKRSNDRILVVSAETDHHFSRTALMYIFMGDLTYQDTKPYPDEFWEKNRIDLKRGWVDKIDTESQCVVFSDGYRNHFDELVLATGARPNKFGWPGQDLDGVQGLYSYQDLENMERLAPTTRRAVIVGGGLIGVEVAEMLLTRGVEVTFLVREKNFWGSVLPEGEAKMVNREIHRHHIDLRLESELKEILPDENGRARAVVTKGGETIDCQMVFLTVGVSPNIDFVRATGIECDRGILIDDRFRTSAPHVWAGGDCAQHREPAPGRRPVEQVWYTGKIHGEHIAANLCGDDRPYNPGVWFNSAKFFDIEYQTYGVVMPQPKDHEEDFYWEHAEGNKSFRLRFDRESGAVTGVNVFGLRHRHAVWETWLNRRTRVEDVMAHLGAANFDPEFYRQHEPDIVARFNGIFPERAVKLQTRKGLFSKFLETISHTEPQRSRRSRYEPIHLRGSVCDSSIFMNDLNANLSYESHSLAHNGTRLSVIEKTGLTACGLGMLVLFSALFAGQATIPDAARSAWLVASWTLIAGGGVAYGLHKHLRDKPGIRNHGKTTEGLTARGALGWTVGVVFTGFYILLYWFPGTLEGLIRLHDPLSQLLRGKPADQWFLYGTFYTAAIWVMGAKALAKYRHSRYHTVRTWVIMTVQMVFAFLLPAIFVKLNQPEVYLSYLWPLAYDKLFPGTLDGFLEAGNIGYFLVGWFVIGTLIATPILTYYYGKRWYCSWVCGCGGLANTFGDPWRQNSDKSLKAWKIERWMVHSILVVIVLLTTLLWFEPHLPDFAKGPVYVLRQWYGFLIGAAFAGVIGVGFYPLMGTRVWCRFGCPMAAILGLLQRFNSRFRITTNGAQCISCGNCSKYCEMGIDVRHYAQRGQNIIRASCVGCGMCASVCPRGVLSLENGPQQGRYNAEHGLSQLDDWKSR